MNDDTDGAATATAASHNAPIVSLLPAATEILAALGVWGRVAGVTHACDVPDAALRLPHVTASRIDAAHDALDIDRQVHIAAGSGQALFTLDEAMLRALHPALIVTQGLGEVCAIDEREMHRIASTLTPPAQVHTIAARTLEGVLASIEGLALVVGAEDEGRELVAGLRARMRRVHETLKAAGAPRPRVAVIEWTDPVYAAGHWVPDMVRRAGGVDALATAGEHSRPCPAPSVRDAAPDVIVFAPCGFALERADKEARATLARDEWAWARSKRVVVMDGNAFTSRPGPRLVEGIEIMARLFNPGCFTPLDLARGAILVP
ncbi:MAG: ABC transporter substrate-binding protein [Gemmatimonadaceae bacterium]|nr:ABC transporter substrate-binding protein [Gemmatimonadaceae bacterium]